MKTVLLLLSLFVFSNVSAQPQGGKDRGERVEALYIAYITRELKLTETEAEKFWPVHTLYDAELKALSKNLSEIDRLEAQLVIKKKYEERFSKVIGKERTDEFFRKDAAFRERLIERLKQKRGGSFIEE